MILGKIRIQNFKSIKDTGWVYLSRTDFITIAAGQNESGKTSFLRALRFFEEGEYPTMKDDDYRIDTHPRVDCTFFLTDQEYENLCSVTSEEIANFYKKNGFNFLRGNVDDDSFDLRYSYPGEIKLLVAAFNESQKVKSEGEEGAPSEEFNPFEYFQKIRPEIVFYSSFEGGVLPGKISYDDIPSNQAVKDFEKVYSVNFQEILSDSTTDQKRTKVTEEIRKMASESLNAYWHQQISNEEAPYHYEITPFPQLGNPSTSYVNFFVSQGDGIPLKISQKSLGFQWFSGFILRLRAHQQELRERGLILLIDEPGQGLHEIAQQDVKDVMEELASESKIQIIYSTHQPVLLGKEEIDFSRLLLVDRDRAKGSLFKSISQFVSSHGSLDALAPIRTALGMVTLTDPFSQKKTVITEGITEYFFFKTFFGADFTIIPSAGVDQTPNIFAILYGWGIPAKVIVDDDVQGRKAFGKIKKEFFGIDDIGLEKTVYKLEGHNGIENLLSQNVINEIMSDFSVEFDVTKTKVENVNRIGKLIFAKKFFDKYQNDKSALFSDTEISGNIEKINKFLAL